MVFYHFQKYWLHNIFLKAVNLLLMIANVIKYFTDGELRRSRHSGQE